MFPVTYLRRLAGTLPLIGILAIIPLQGIANATEPLPDNPVVPLCNCPIALETIPAAPKTAAGHIELRATKEGIFVINAIAIPPPTGAITPILRVRKESGEPLEEFSGWSHTFNIPADGLESPLVLEVAIKCPNTGSTQEKICHTRRFGFSPCETGDCGSGSSSSSSPNASVGLSASCQGGTGEPSGDVDPARADSFKFALPVGMSAHGDERTGIHFSNVPGAPITEEDFQINSNGGYTVQADGKIVTETTETTIVEENGGVTVKIFNPGAQTPFRTYFFISEDAGQIKKLTLTETRCGQQPIIHQWKIENGEHSFSSANGMRRKSVVIVGSNDPLVRIEEHRIFELVGNAEQLVSYEQIHYRLFEWGERITKRIIEPASDDPSAPATANLISTWTYGGPADGHAYGRLMEHTRHDGYSETHTYGTDFHQINSTGNRQRKTTWVTNSTIVGSQTSWAASSITREEKIGAMIVSKTVETRAGNTTTVDRYSNANSFLRTTITNKPSGADFGSLPELIVHPDGTATLHTYLRTAGPDQLTVTVEEGVLDDDVITDGTRTCSIFNKHGQVVEKYVEDIASGKKLSHAKAALVDGFGRPEIIHHFPVANGQPAYTEGRSYSCCRLATETDIHGVVTSYQYDLLGRLTKTTKHNVTHETVYSGLTVVNHRYAAGDAALQSNKVSQSARNLAGTIRNQWDPNPASPIAGLLVQTTKTTTYLPVPGISRRVETTVPGGHSHIEDYSPDGQLKESYGALGPHYEYYYAATAEGRRNSRAIREGADRREVSATQHDWLGRVIRTGQMATLTSQTITDPTVQGYEEGTGRLLTSTDPDGVVTRFGYNARGERETTAIKLNNSNLIQYGVDQVTRSKTFVTDRGNNPAIPVIRTETLVWQDGAAEASPTLVAYSERTPDGLKSWSWELGSGETSSVSTTGPARTETVTRPDLTYTKTIYSSGLVDRVERFNSANVLISSVAMRNNSNVALSGYDTLRRPTHQFDSRTGITTTAYRSLTSDVVASVTDHGARTTVFSYDVRGRRTVVNAPNTANYSTIPAGSFLNDTVTSYNPDGTVSGVSGGQNYPVTYTYDYAGRMKTMTTSGSAGSAITAWNYSPTTGQLVSKRYNSNAAGTAGSGPDYQYTAAGRLWKRLWARPVSSTDSTRVTTTYDYSHGRLQSVSYNDGTPNLFYTYDALGRKKLVKRGATQLIDHAEYVYDEANLRLKTEKLNLDTLPRELQRYYDGFGRPLSLAMAASGTSTNEYSTAYGYDAAGRLQNVWSHPLIHATTKAPIGPPTFTYGYTYTQAGSQALRVGTNSGQNLKQDYMPYTVTRNSQASGQPALTATRTYEGTRDVLNKIENRAGATVHSSYTYGVNLIGQRESVTTTGAAFGATQASWTWRYDALGQVIRADHGATTTRDRAYEYDAIGNRVKSSSGNFVLPPQPNWVSNQLNQYTTANGVALPTTPVPAPYDADGNLTAGPVPGSAGNDLGALPPVNAVMKWDAENRLREMNVSGTVVTYTYDHLSRLIVRTAGSATRHYHYDGWNRITEHLGGTAGTSLYNTFTWGLDLSGTMQGAGGVGGLLATRHVGTTASPDYFPTYDGNGNVSEYLTVSGGNAVHYEYDPFGTLTHRTGLTTDRFEYRFSTKPRDVTSGLYYYGYRWYDPYTGRWPSRDPIGERGGVNLYGFVGNSPISLLDIKGERPFSPEPPLDNGWGPGVAPPAPGQPPPAPRDPWSNRDWALPGFSSPFFWPCYEFKCCESCKRCCYAAYTAGQAVAKNGLYSRARACANLRHPAAILACSLGVVGYYGIQQKGLADGLRKCLKYCSDLPPCAEINS